MLRVSLIGLVLTGACALAADVPSTAPAKPRSPAAVEAIAKADKALADAEAAYRAAVLAAKRTELTELRGAQDLAMKSGPRELPEANAIDAAARQVQAEIDALVAPPPGPARRHVIDARMDWQDTVEVKSGQAVAVTADGRWSVGTDAKGRHWCGPAGEVIGGRRAGCLEMRIGDGPSRLVGASLKFQADRSGVIQLRMHDDGPREDNEGQVTAVVVTR